MSLRAAIRAKVTAARLEAGADQRDEIAKAARTYFKLACEPDRAAAAARSLRSAACPAPANRCWRGRSRRMSCQRPAPCCCAPMSSARSLFGVDETDRLPAEAYSAEAGAKVYASLYDKARRIIAAGHSVDRRCGLRTARGAHGRLSDRALCGVAFTGCSSPRTSRPERRASALAATMPPMRMPGSRAAGGLRSRRDRLDTRSTRRAHRTTRSSMPKLRCARDAFLRMHR